MIIKWRGHASFYIETGKTRIITDPFGEAAGYPLSIREADIVTVSHEHWDHCGVDTLEGNPLVIKDLGEHTLPSVCDSRPVR